MFPATAPTGAALAPIPHILPTLAERQPRGSTSRQALNSIPARNFFGEGHDAPLLVESPAGATGLLPWRDSDPPPICPEVKTVPVGSEPCGVPSFEGSLGGDGDGNHWDDLPVQEK